ncbi:hypothetical protein VN12_12980 [Pirellula sp. SH-Sr6A]|nr:hypothetical protein VN12_12980 [Pirellula sp. SH-Sr6A]
MARKTRLVPRGDQGVATGPIHDLTPEDVAIVPREIEHLEKELQTKEIRPTNEALPRQGKVRHAMANDPVPPMALETDVVDLAPEDPAVERAAEEVLEERAVVGPVVAHTRLDLLGEQADPSSDQEKIDPASALAADHLEPVAVPRTGLGEDQGAQAAQRADQAERGDQPGDRVAKDAQCEVRAVKADRCEVQAARDALHEVRAVKADPHEVQAARGDLLADLLGEGAPGASQVANASADRAAASRSPKSAGHRAPIHPSLRGQKQTSPCRASVAPSIRGAEYLSQGKPVPLPNPS